jgi:hypothetical protein
MAIIGKINTIGVLVKRVIFEAREANCLIYVGY